MKARYTLILPLLCLPALHAQEAEPGYQLTIGAAVSFSAREPDNAMGRFHCDKEGKLVISGYLTVEDDDKYLYYGNYFYRRRDESRVTIEPGTRCSIELLDRR